MAEGVALERAMGRYACGKGRAAGLDRRARVKTRPARTAQARRTQGCLGGGQGEAFQAAGGAAIASNSPGGARRRMRASPTPALGRRVRPGWAPAGPGVRKSLSGLKFFMACWLLAVLTGLFYPEIMTLILGLWAAVGTGKAVQTPLICLKVLLSLA